MSRAARQSIIILIALVIGAFAFAGLTYFEKEQLAKDKRSLEQKVEEFQLREQSMTREKQQLETKLKETDAARAELQVKLSGVDTNVQGLNDKIKSLSTESDDLKKQVEALRKEREELVVKLQAAPKEKIVYADKTSEGGAAPAGQQPSSGTSATPAPANTTEQASAATTPPPASPQATDLSALKENDQYWAAVLKEKAALEVELENIKNGLTDHQVELVDLKKQNSDLQLELTDLKNQKAAIDHEIKNGQDLADNLSLELARVKNDKKFSEERINSLGKENTSLRDQIKNLTSTKIALEKSIVRLQDDKKVMEKKLIKTEGVIQERIDEIWKIKEDLTKSFKSTSKNSKSNEIELPPIVVSSGADSLSMLSPDADNDQSPEVSKNGRAGKSAIIEGNVVSINPENNFVIVDLGEKEGIKIGDPLSVYRGSEFVAGLEVIQVRKDIAAADIKNKTSSIQVGDIVR